MSDEIVREFLVESAENLDLLDRELVRLEKDPRNRDTLASVFRTIHTIKGTCGFLGFTKLESVAHVGENLLSKLRDGELALSPDITTALLQMVDAIRQMLASVEAAGNEGERNDQALIETLTRLLQGAAQSTPKTISADATPADAKEATEKPPIAKVPDETTSAPVPNALPEVAIKAELEANVHDAGMDLGDPSPQAAAEAPQPNRGAASESSIRVDVVLLDKLMNLVGELVLARNQILQFSNGKEDAGLHRAEPAAQPDHHRAAGRRDEDAHAAHRQHLEQVSTHRPRRRHHVRQTGAHRDGREGNRARQNDHRSHQRSAHSHRAQFRGSRHRDAAQACRRGQVRRRPAVAARVSRGRAGNHRDF